MKKLLDKIFGIPKTDYRTSYDPTPPTLSEIGGSWGREVEYDTMRLVQDLRNYSEGITFFTPEPLRKCKGCGSSDSHKGRCRYCRSII